MFDLLLNSLFPLRCVGNCGVWNTALCEPCLQQSIHPACRIIDSAFRLYNLGVYQQTILQTAIHNLKYSGIQPLGKILGSELNIFITTNSYDYIVPIPLHSRRYRERGFNQSWLLAKSMNAKSIRILERQRYTTPQATLQRSSRSTNLKGAFVISNEYQGVIRNSRILLIDDVYTTGSTIQSCREVLLNAGAKQVDAAVIAID